MSYKLLEKFTDFKLPEEMMMLIKRKLINTPVNMLKMFMFAENEKISNEDIDYWMSIGPGRKSDESYSEYKDRQKFQRALVRYRSYIYNYKTI